MELDELKKSWNALDKRLQKQTVTSEEQIARLIANHKANTRKCLGRITDVQRFSIIIGVIILAALGMLLILMGPLTDSPEVQCKATVILAFIAISVIAGMWWDWKSYRWSTSIRIDQMSVAEVSHRMAVLRNWTRYEIIGVCLWAVLFNSLNYWAMDYYHRPIGAQVLLIAVFILFDTFIIYLFYKKAMYKHLNHINKNIEELKDICTE